jgi:methanethiol S-methyltransferase
MSLSHFILAIGWIVYCTLHSILAATTVKKIPRRWMGEHSRFYRLYYIIFSFVGLIALIYMMLTISSPLIFVPTPATNITGILISATGALIMAICIGKYFFQLSGLKSLIREESSNELMITGIHKYVRHPLYTGTFIFIWGLLVVFPFLSLLISNIIITIYTLIGIRFEEMKLEKEFGDSYKLYKQNTPMLIPWFRD